MVEINVDGNSILSATINNNSAALVTAGGDIALNNTVGPYVVHTSGDNVNCYTFGDDIEVFERGSIDQTLLHGYGINSTQIAYAQDKSTIVVASRETGKQEFSINLDTSEFEDPTDTKMSDDYLIFGCEENGSHKSKLYDLNTQSLVYENSGLSDVHGVSIDNNSNYYGVAHGGNYDVWSISDNTNTVDGAISGDSPNVWDIDVTTDSNGNLQYIYVGDGVVGGTSTVVDFESTGIDDPYGCGINDTHYAYSEYGDDTVTIKEKGTYNTVKTFTSAGGPSGLAMTNNHLIYYAATFGDIVFVDLSDYSTKTRSTFSYRLNRPDIVDN